MERVQKSQLAKCFLLFLFLFLLFLTPFVSASMRPSYLYFLLNLLIIVLGIEAGFLSSILSGPAPRDEKKPVAINIIAAPITVPNSEGSMQIMAKAADQTNLTVLVPEMMTERKTNFGSAAAARVHKAIKRCPTRPSLFFIGDGGFKELEEKEEEAVEEKVAAPMAERAAGELSKQELFMKAELFIGNFYKQLKMQRKESWKKINSWALS